MTTIVEDHGYPLIWFGGHDMTDVAEPRTEAAKSLHDAIETMESVSVEWAPAHSAPYVSKYIVLPIVDIWIRRIEAEAATLALADVAEKDAAWTEAEVRFVLLATAVMQLRDFLALHRKATGRSDVNIRKVITLLDQALSDEDNEPAEESR